MPSPSFRARPCAVAAVAATLFGGSGADSLVGGTGRDALYGGNGNDRCREASDTQSSC